MYYICACPFCEQGILGFWLCSDGDTVVFVCDECDSLWLDPTNINENNSIYCHKNDDFISEKNCYASSIKGAHWATIDEIKKAGLEKYIKGESSPL